MIEVVSHFRDYLYEMFVLKFDFWLAFGLFAQLLFTARFVVQWLASERAGTSVVPISFWYLSLIGGGMLMIYGVERKEPIIIIGQALAVAIYVRNLVLLHRKPRSTSAT
jgi:lipid-A-disaccharide synthase-like uncharacterized protein